MDSSLRFLRNVPDRGIAFRDDGPGLSIYATITIGLVLSLTVISCFVVCVLRLRQYRHRRCQDRCLADVEVQQSQLSIKKTALEPPPPPPDFEYIQRTLQSASSYVRQCLMLSPSSQEPHPKDEDTEYDDDKKEEIASALTSTTVRASPDHINTNIGIEMQEKYREEGED